MTLLTWAVTGATGFVGSHVVARLRREGDVVRCLARAGSDTRTLQAGGSVVVAGDLEDETALAALVDGADVALHVAGAIAAADEATFQRVNGAGTARLAAAAFRGGVSRLVYVSSLAVTGPTQPGAPLDESAPPRPITAYGRSKLEGERAVRSAGVPFTIVRPSVVYGPGDRQTLRLFRLARRGLAPVLGDGSRELSLVHVHDLADAVRLCGLSRSTLGGTYHAAHATPLTHLQLMQAVARAVGRQAITLRIPPRVVLAGLSISGALARVRGAATMLGSEKAAELLAPAWICSSDAIARDAGWRAATPHDTGLEATARWYSEAGWL